MKSRKINKALAVYLFVTSSLVVIINFVLFCNLSIYNFIQNKDIYKTIHYNSMVMSENKFSQNRVIVPRGTITPKYVKGIYLTAYSASRTDWIKRLIEKIKEGGEINTVVIDIKDSSGFVLYDSQIEMINRMKLKKVILKDVKTVVKQFHDANIYVIARQTVFQDPILSKLNPKLAIKNKKGGTWYNYKGLAFADPQNKEVWEYNIKIAKEATSLGFDEINFDYVRYPSDGSISQIDFNIPAGKTKSDIMNSFFKYLSDQLTPTTKISLDLFGLTMDSINTKYDLGIGQRLLDTLDYFDYSCPMMYPSHYSKNYLGYSNPAAHPGPVIAYGIKKASPYFQNKRAKLRPWLQAFNLGATYDKTMIKAEINAVENTRSTEGWILWNARNYYEDYIYKK